MAHTPPEGIRALIERPMAGRIVMSAFPGLRRDAGGTVRVDHAGQGAVLQYMASCGVQNLVALAEDRDLPTGAMDDLQVHARVHEITLDRRPIVDFGVPDAMFMDRWHRERRARASAVARGETMAVCCRHGAGRSGLIAVLLLMENGVSMPEALALVRAGFAEAVETREQETWLERQAAALR